MAKPSVADTVKVWVQKEGQEEDDAIDIYISKDATLR